MLRWPQSLALRAVTALLAVHVATIMIALGFAVMEGRTTRLGGASLALEFAREELVYRQSGWVVPDDGALASLAARNPSLWLIGRDQDRLLIVGEPPTAARQLFGPTTGSETADSEGLEALLPEVAVERTDIDGRAILLAAGGVDPDAVTSGDIIRSFSSAPVIAVVLGLGVLGVFALLLAIPLLAQAIRPVVEDAASIQPGEVGRRLDESRTPPELLPLARAFNGALERLEVELGRRRRLISNVAHELRTPLAVLSLRVDALTSPAEEREGLQAALFRISRLVEQMLDLERLSTSTAPRVAVDLAEVTQEVVASLAPMVLDAGYELAFEARQSPVILETDRDALSRALTNLISNAVQHGGGSGLITILLAEGWLEVIDEGPGVSEALQPRLFEAFARGNGEAGGSGLGLHLTRELMRGLGGDVSWRRQRGRTIFRLQFDEAAARVS